MIYTFSFGFGHSCVCGRALARCYTHVEADDIELAAERMVDRWGLKWAHRYESDEAAGVEQYDMRFVPTNFDDESLCPCGDADLREVRRRELRTEINAMREAQHAVYAIGKRVEASELQAFAPLLAAYADLAEAAFEAGVDHKLSTIAELAPVAERVAHKGGYIGEKFGRLFGPWFKAAPAMYRLFRRESRIEPLEQIGWDALEALVQQWRDLAHAEIEDVGGDPAVAMARKMCAADLLELVHALRR